MQERRQSVRQKSLFRGVVYFDNNPCAAECTVRDISETGARLWLSSMPAAATESLELHIPLKSEKHKCRVMWRADSEVGVAFIGKNALPGDDAVAERISKLEEEIRALKQIVKRLQRTGSNIAEVA